MTWRELSSYVQGLPPHARVRTALREGREEPTGEQVLLADVFDMLQRVNWTLQAVNASKDKAPKPPKPYPRWWLASGPGRAPDKQRLERLERARERARDRKRQMQLGAIA